MSTAPSPLAGRYELQHEIGHGGAASVYVARDTHLERQVAVKLLHPELANALGHGRFLREIRIASGLRHPHIVPVLDFGETDGQLWYVMPYLEGGSLRGRLEHEGQLRMERAMQWGAEIADALAFAHSQGFVHRDVKPENILLDGDHALLADFGIARGIDAATRETLTSAGIAVGTPAYMSPEQASGSGEIDGRSDVYSLGCVLYECLAGVPPFTGPTPQSIIAQRFAHAPHPVASYRDTVSAPVAELVGSALHMAPADRPSAADAREVLRGEWTGELRVSGRRSGVRAAVPARRISTRTRVVATAGVALLAAAAVGRAMWTSSPAPDAGKVVIYPLVNGANSVGGVSSLIGLALENVPSVRWVEGEQLVKAPSGDPGTSHGERLKAARRAGAGHFIDGSVVVTGDSVRVVMRLVAVDNDSIVARAGASARGNAAVASTLALRAVGQLLPQLLAPGTQGDVLALSERNPAAIAAFLVGENEFRQSRYVEALARYQEALAIDSNLAIAALKAARSARSLFHEDDARRFLAIALARDSMLPGANLHFARGLASLYQSNADVALAELANASAMAPRWAEAHAAIADVYYYVGGDSIGGVDVDSAARAEYGKARALDSSFTPALFHLTWIAGRARDSADMQAALASYVAAKGPDTSFVVAATAGLRCLGGGTRAVDWHSLAHTHGEALVQLGKNFAGGDDFSCSRAALSAVLFRDAPPDRHHFGAILVLQAIAVATRDSALLDSLLRSEAGVPLQIGSVAVLSNVADPDWPLLRSIAEREADAMLRRPDQFAAEQLWMLGVWLESRNRGAELKRVEQMVDARSRRRAGALSPTAASLAARRLLLDGDTAAALPYLAHPDTNAALESIAWMFRGALVADRMLLARISLKLGDARRAVRYAERADHPFPANAIMFRRASLSVREQAYRQLGDVASARVARGRLNALDKNVR